MILDVDGIHTFYGTSHILFGLSLHVRPGEVVGLLGRNGAGKTTTLRSIVGIPAPRSGSIRFRGEEIARKPPYEVAQHGIAFIPDTRRIFPDLTVRDNLEIARRPARDDTGWTVDRVYALFPKLSELERRKGSHLSGGEQQMVAIGRALMGNPLLLLMDEPTQGLAPLVIKMLGEQIHGLQAEGVTASTTGASASRGRSRSWKPTRASGAGTCSPDPRGTLRTEAIPSPTCLTRQRIVDRLGRLLVHRGPERRFRVDTA